MSVVKMGESIVRMPARLRTRLKDPKFAKLKSTPVIIKGRRPEFYHRLNQVYDTKRPLPLISTAWHRRGVKNGDYFTIFPSGKNPALQSLKPSLSTFKSLGLSQSICEHLSANKYKSPTEIQQKAIPEILKYETHVAVGAATGSGKTLSYLLPIIEHIKRFGNADEPKKPRGLILVPTSELCHQVHQVCLQFNNLINITHIHNLMTPIEVKHFLQQKSDIVVTSPSSFLAFLQKKRLDISHCRFLVVDETDTLLDESFHYLIEAIFSRLVISNGVDLFCQLIFCGATLPVEMKKITALVTGTAGLEQVCGSGLNRCQYHVKQTFIRCGPNKAQLLVKSLLEKLVINPGTILIFCNSYRSVRSLSQFLTNENIKHSSVTQNMPVDERVKLTSLLRDGFVKVLITTDVVSRGYDSLSVKHVINYDFPLRISDYIHRTGRVGRVGQNGGEVTSYVTRPYHAELVKEIETAVRLGRSFKDVDADVRRQYREFADSRAMEKSEETHDVPDFNRS